MRIAIAGDHTSPRHKAAIVAHLRAAGHEVQDFGTDSEATCDFPDVVTAPCTGVLEGRFDRAVLICGTGIGISISANKIRGIRCALVHDIFTARMAREHNNAHALALGARVVDIPTALTLVDTFLDAVFEERHQRRLDKIAALEKHC
jgi:ribose 5-phosphate isomerase B